VEEIIEIWNRDLEDQVIAFHEQASIIQQWDAELMKNLGKLHTLQQSVANVELSQQKLTRILDGIKVSQHDLVNMLDILESQVDAVSRKPVTKDEYNRYRTYELAEEVDDSLAVLSESFSSTVEQLNKSTNKQLDIAHNPVAQIVKILNVHTASLEYLNTAATQLEKKLFNTSNVLQQTQQQQQQSAVTSQYGDIMTSRMRI
jgi:nuclear pore complex protein Nup62